MLRIFAVLSMLTMSSLSTPAQQTKSSDPNSNEVSKASRDKSKDVEVYGRIKELKGGQKIVIQVDNALDKTYNLADKNRSIKIAEDLAIGDPVKVMESKETKDVQIVRDVRADQGQ